MAPGDDAVYVVNRTSAARTEGVRTTVWTLAEDFISQFGAYSDGKRRFYLADSAKNRIQVYQKNKTPVLS